MFRLFWLSLAIAVDQGDSLDPAEECPDEVSSNLIGRTTTSVLEPSVGIINVTTLITLWWVGVYSPSLTSYWSDVEYIPLL